MKNYFPAISDAMTTFRILSTSYLLPEIVIVG
jgi:hypothetical protein